MTGSNNFSVQPSRVLGLYRLTVLTSAALVFLVQPMFARLVLPLLGGTPSVWNTCLMFFQAMLLAGYAYAHLTSTWLDLRRQAALHCLLLLAALAALPIGLPADWKPTTDRSPAAWLLGLSAVSVGLPFFLVSATAPLIQKWFTATGHPRSGDPYFLYAASNLGSIVALVGYPLVVEPNLRLSQQTWLWSAGYVLLVVLIGACAVPVWKRGGKARSEIEGRGDAAGRPSIGRRVYWLALAFAPSSWLLGVTAYLTTDVAPAPMLWVIPLTLYLLSFVLVFSRRQWVPQGWLVWLLPPAVLWLVLSILLPAGPLVLLVHLAAFFIGALTCHGALAADRPAPAHLTSFYLWMSAGGVLGGAFNVLVAPLVFPWLVEYPLAIALASLLCLKSPHRELQHGLLLRATGVATLAAGLAAFNLDYGRPEWLVVLAVSCIGALVLLYLGNLWKAFAWVAAVPLLASQVAPPAPGEVLFAGRSYFGTHWVVATMKGGQRHHDFLHGITLHGRQCRTPERRCVPLTYYYPEGPLGQLFRTLEPGPTGQNVAMVGLGTGSAACYAHPLRQFTFYEIDPLVMRLAETPEYFSFLSECSQGRYRVVLGDGRLKLAEAADGEYDLIMLDAFSSDAVPIHLLTREAVKVYFSKLRAGGLVVFHASNRHLNLEEVLAAVAADGGLACYTQRDLVVSAEESNLGKAASVWVILARREADLGDLAGDSRWQPVEPPSGARAWTDDYANIVAALDWW